MVRLSLSSDFKDFSGDQKAGLTEAVNLPGRIVLIVNLNEKTEKIKSLSVLLLWLCSGGVVSAYGGPGQDFAAPPPNPPKVELLYPYE